MLFRENAQRELVDADADFDERSSVDAINAIDVLSYIPEHVSNAAAGRLVASPDPNLAGMLIIREN